MGPSGRTENIWRRNYSTPILIILQDKVKVMNFLNRELVQKIQFVMIIMKPENLKIWHKLPTIIPCPQMDTDHSSHVEVAVGNNQIVKSDWLWNPIKTLHYQNLALKIAFLFLP